MKIGKCEGVIKFYHKDSCLSSKKERWNVNIYWVDKKTITGKLQRKSLLFFYIERILSAGWKRGITRNTDLEWIATSVFVWQLIILHRALSRLTAIADRQLSIFTFHSCILVFAKVVRLAHVSPPVPDCSTIRNSCKMNGSSGDQRNWIEATLKPTSSDYGAFVTKAGLRLTGKGDSIIVIRKLCWQKPDITGEIPAI